MNRDEMGLVEQDLVLVPRGHPGRLFPGLSGVFTHEAEPQPWWLDVRPHSQTWKIVPGLPPLPSRSERNSKGGVWGMARIVGILAAVASLVLTAGAGTRW